LLEEFYRNIASLLAFEFRGSDHLKAFFHNFDPSRVAETPPFKMSDYVSKDSSFLDFANKNG